MADTPILEETENATEELTNSLLFNSAKNQFKCNGSVELFESFLYQTLGLSANDVTKSGNETCTVWRTSSVIFNLYTKTKTLLIQGKAVDYTGDLLLQTIQAVKNQNSAESLDESSRCRTYNGWSTSTSRTNVTNSVCRRPKRSLACERRF